MYTYIYDMQNIIYMAGNTKCVMKESIVSNPVRKVIIKNKYYIVCNNPLLSNTAILNTYVYHHFIKEHHHSIFDLSLLHMMKIIIKKSFFHHG